MKKTLILNGSPRKKGDTAFMIQTFQEAIGGEVRILDAYYEKIRPCVDCRWCFDHNGCTIQDAMQDYLEYIQDCDYIVLASPVYFEELTGMLLAVLSRLQTFFSARYIRKEDPVPKGKKGAVFLAAGGIGPREKAESTAKMLLKQLNCEVIDTVYAGKTDSTPVSEREDIQRQIQDIAKRLLEM